MGHYYTPSAAATAGIRSGRAANRGKDAKFCAFTAAVTADWSIALAVIAAISAGNVVTVPVAASAVAISRRPWLSNSSGKALAGDIIRDLVPSK